MGRHPERSRFSGGAKDLARTPFAEGPGGTNENSPPVPLAGRCRRKLNRVPEGHLKQLQDWRLALLKRFPSARSSGDDQWYVWLELADGSDTVLASTTKHLVPLDNTAPHILVPALQAQGCGS